MAVVQVQNVCDPTNTANVWIANFTGVPIVAITKRTLAYQAAVAIAATIAVVVAAPALFRERPFADLLHVARAGETVPGLYAPASARDRIAIDDDGTPPSKLAADAVISALSGGAWQTMRVHENPNATDCTQKRYAAYVYVSTSKFALIEGDDLDVGLRLQDCGGWIVAQWHDHAINGDARALALQGVARLQAWTRAQPVRSANLFSLGVASLPSDKPTYFYAFFKSDDGNLRAYVRAGGPAYAAGMRSGDVIDTIDGQAWWRYGTYQSQRMAYDGRPHAFEVSRAGRSIQITLAAPFSA
jgi:hypothetical protein